MRRWYDMSSASSSHLPWLHSAESFMQLTSLICGFWWQIVNTTPPCFCLFFFFLLAVSVGRLTPVWWICLPASLCWQGEAGFVSLRRWISTTVTVCAPLKKIILNSCYCDGGTRRREVFIFSSSFLIFFLLLVPYRLITRALPTGSNFQRCVQCGVEFFEIALLSEHLGIVKHLWNVSSWHPANI